MLLNKEVVIRVPGTSSQDSPESSRSAKMDLLFRLFCFSFFQILCNRVASTILGHVQFLQM